MGYVAWSVVFGEQPSASKWNILGANDASFNDGSGIAAGAIAGTKLANGAVTFDKVAAGAAVQLVYNSSTAVATGSTLIPLDDTIPQIGEGNEYMTQAITPKAATNILVIEATVYVSSSVANNMIAAIFQDATANALFATEDLIALGGGAEATIKIRHIMVAGTTSATTFRLRMGGNLAGTTTFNGRLGGRYFGATPKSTMSITEYKV